MKEMANVGFNAESELGDRVRTEQSVTGIAETGQDVSTFVEAAVHGSSENGYLRVVVLQFLNSLGSRNEKGAADVHCTCIAQGADGLDGGSAGRKHWVEKNHIVGFEIWRVLQVVRLGFQRFLIAGQANVGDGGLRHEVEETFEKTQARPQDRQQGDRTPQPPPGGRLQRRDAWNFNRRKIRSDLWNHQ